MPRIGFGTNSDSLSAQRSLARASDQFAATSERLSSGMRINSAGDDAAGLSVLSLLDSNSRVLSQGLRNVNDAISLLTVNEGALQALSSITQRQLELATEAANEAYTDEQRAALDAESSALTQEFNRIVSSTSFNNLSTLDGTLAEFRVQSGYGVDGGIGLAVSQELLHAEFDGTAYGDQTSLTVTAGNFAVGDINGDGTDEFVAIHGANARVYSGDGTLLQTIASAAGSTVVLTDVNGDGNLDIGSSYASSGLVNFALGNGDGSFRAFGTSVTSVFTAVDIGFGDWNGDGYADFVQLYAGSSSGAYRLKLGNGDGSFRNYIDAQISGASVGISIRMADLNNDGKDDIITASSNNQLHVQLGGATVNIFVAGAASGDTIVGMDDFTGDGIVDVITSNSGSFEMSIGTGSGTFSSSPSFTITGTARAVGDFNGDGYTDVLAASGTSGSIRFGNGNGTFKAATSSFTLTAAANVSAAAGDFNGDGNLDIVANSVAAANISLQTRGSTLTARGEDVDLTTALRAQFAITRLTGQLTRIEEELGVVGAAQSRLLSTASNLSSLRENSIAAASRIRDIDVASEVAEYTRIQILQNSGAAVLAQANQSPQILLTLLA